MEQWKRALALAPALAAAGGCTYLADWTRDSVGLDENPVRTEYDDGRPQGLAGSGFDAHRRLVAAIQTLVDPQASRDVADPAAAVFDRAEEYYQVGRLAMRSQCESFMQTLASVDGQTTFGQDLANNFFDTATVAASVSQSPAIWATGLSATQNSFNSVSGSAQRFLMLTDSVGALRERVLDRMEAAEGAPVDFEAHRANKNDSAVALDMARRSLLAVQRYGAPCTEAGIRLIISEALSTDALTVQARTSRFETYLSVITGIINEDQAKSERHEIDDAGVRLLYLWAISAGADISTDAGKVRNQIETVNLPFMEGLSTAAKGRVSYYVQQAIVDRPDLRSSLETLRDELLSGYRERTEPSEQTPAEAPPEAPAPETPPEAPDQ